jgi:hypothetical protein
MIRKAARRPTCDSYMPFRTLTADLAALKEHG